MVAVDVSVPEPDSTSTVPGMAIWGWMSEADLRWLSARAAEMQSIVEVGSLHGRSSYALLDACPGPVYCIDPGMHVTQFMANCGHFENCVPIHGFSPGAAFADEIPSMIDMTFIDGAHDEASVLLDLDAWTPKTRRLICGHDYLHDGYPDVTSVVDSWFGDRVRQVDGSGIWYVELA